MRIRLFLESPSGAVRLPRANLSIIQGLIYQVLPEQIAGPLHETGFPYERRRFKLFAFSWLRGKGAPKPSGDAVSFRSPLELVISSPRKEILLGAAQGLLEPRTLRLGNNEVTCSHVESSAPKAEGSEITIRTLSPITCYTTEAREEGRKRTIYHAPDEEPFLGQVQENLRRKSSLVFPEEDFAESRVTLEPVGRFRPKHNRFQAGDSHKILGWQGRFRLRGPQRMLQVALDAGLGAKNSAGWGCIALDGAG
ncbi:MAG: CRISPR-associated endoribonuclease Cas6 [Synergistales bacterium]|nr:CRISPR-associated endoribonuclease Cas6 [Synergistales bacterium]